jgi:hypothetical protein
LGRVKLKENVNLKKLAITRRNWEILEETVSYWKRLVDIGRNCQWMEITRRNRKKLDLTR